MRAPARPRPTAYANLETALRVCDLQVVIDVTVPDAVVEFRYGPVVVARATVRRRTEVA